mmetsp:Transcript_8581/g.24656  ORF Transcript_8581/g.24656 Transcript_8581/m.24656 type:complete len:189 (-) Transcript_8581:73-639(-)
MATEPTVPYLPADLAEPEEVVSLVRSRRGGRLLNLDRVLLHSPAYAQGWSALFDTVRGSSFSLDPALKELVICGVAVLNGAQYEWEHHAPPFLKAGGSQQQLDELRRILEGGASEQELQQCEVFSELERDAIRLTVEMTRNVSPPQNLMQSLRESLGPQRLVELTGSIAAYNMVSRFLVAMNISTEGE